MKRYLLLGVLLLVFLSIAVVKSQLFDDYLNTTGDSSGQSEDMVDIEEFIPGIAVDLVYASPDNIHGQTIYAIEKAYLRRGTAVKLKQAQEEFVARGYGLKVWDAYRPPEAQFKLWEIMPDSRFVVNPWEGFSYHSRGVAVDVTLVNQKGEEIIMPSPFDDFTPKADREYSDVSAEAAQNARLLEEIMVAHGLQSIFFEWWHFTDCDRDQYEVYDQMGN